MKRSGITCNCFCDIASYFDRGTQIQRLNLNSVVKNSFDEIYIYVLNVRPKKGVNLNADR